MTNRIFSRIGVFLISYINQFNQLKSFKHTNLLTKVENSSSIIPPLDISLSSFLIGPVLTILTCVIVSAVNATLLEIPDPTTILLLLIVYTAAVGGVRSGLVSSLIAIIYFLFLFSNPHHMFRFTDENILKLSLFFLSAIVISFMVGLLNNKVGAISHERYLRKRSEEAERKVNHILESITDAFIALDHNWHFTYINKEAEKVLGKRRKSLLMQNIWQVYPQIKGSHFHEKIQQAITLQKSLSFDEYVARSDRWYEIHIYPTKEGLAIYFSDITEKKELDKRKDEFISMTSHELRSPVTTIKGYVQLLQSKMKNTETSDIVYLQRMSDEIDRLNTIVIDMLDITRMKSGQIRFTDEIFDMNQLIQNIIQDFSHKPNQSHTLILKGKIHSKIKGDKNRIEQVIINLLTNAINYSPQADKVIILLDEDEKNIEISIRDFGQGIPESQKEKIFDQFFRIETEQLEKVSGLGLGLYIAAEIVKYHKGKITVESEEGKGSVFKVSLPKRRSS